MAATRMEEVTFRNFAGGLNTRDHPSELADNEFPVGLNITLDERGSVQKRKGYVDRFGVELDASLVNNLFYWAAQDKTVSQTGAEVHIDNSTSPIHTWSTSARAGYCEFAGNLVMVHPIDGVRQWDGATITTPTNGATRRGNTCFPGQNRVWIGGDPTNPPRLYYTDIGSAGSTSVNQFNDIREKDSALITCVTGASGQDITGRSGLLVFKQDSAYRVYDFTNGAYTTIDTDIGCGSNIGAIGAYGRVYTVSARGIYSTDGLAPMREESMMVENQFSNTLINQSRPDLLAAGRYQDRLRFSLPSVGDTFNSIAYELHPLQNWIVKHTDAGSCYASIGRNSTDLVMGSPTVNGRVYTAYTGNSDNGSNITAQWQTNWKLPYGGNKSRIRRARFVGSGTFDASILQDWATAQSLQTLHVDIASDSALYDSGYLYDAANSLYGPSSFQNHEDFWSIGVFRSVAIRIDETSAAEPFVISHINLLAIELGYM